jgi:hypothetical protein
LNPRVSAAIVLTRNCRRADCYAETNLMIEVMLLGVVFLVGLGAVAAAVIIVAMRLLKKNEPGDSTPLS